MPQKKESNEFNKLLDAIKADDLPSIKSFVTQYKALKDWDWQNTDNQLILRAVRETILLGKLDIVRYFIVEADVAPYSTTYETGDSGPTCPFLAFAVKARQFEIVKLLVEKKAIEADYWKNQGGIRTAVLQNETEVVLYLLANGASKDGFVRDKETYLACAAANSNHELVGTFLEDVHDIVNTLLHLAKKYKQYKKPFKRLEKKRNDYLEKQAKALSENSTKNYDKDVKYSEKEFNEFQPKYQAVETCFFQAAKFLFDYAVGLDFPEFSFLDKLNISGFNFIGVSLNGQPITRALLADLGLKGADKALVTYNDLTKIDSPKRRFTLTTRVNKHIQHCGDINNDGVINLVPLWQAVNRGDIDTVLVRLSAGINPNEKAQECFTYKTMIPIVIAAEKGYFDIVRLLAQHPDINKEDVVAAIVKAKANKHDDIAHYLEEHQDVNTQDKDGNTLLHKAAERGDIEAVNKLLARGADVTLTNKDGYSPLVLAAQNAQYYDEESIEHGKVIALLLNHAQANQAYLNHACAQALKYTVKEGAIQATDLLLASMTEKPIVTHKYIQQGECVKVALPWYSDFIFQALKSRNTIGLLTVLKKYGADFNSRNFVADRTLLNCAIRALPSYDSLRKTLRILDTEVIIDCGNRVGRKNLIKTQQAEIKAATKRFNEELQVLDFLLANGTDVNMADKDELTPLHTLVYETNLSHIEKAYEEVIERLLARQANINATDKNGNTPLHLAADAGDITAINYLVIHGANLNAQNNDGQTPLHLAANKGFVHTTTTLLHLDADCTLRDNKQNTASMLVAKHYERKLKNNSFDNRQQQRDFNDTFNRLQEAFDKTRQILALDIDLIQTKLSAQMEPFAYYTNYAPELFRQATRDGEKTFAQIQTIVNEVVTDLGCTSIARTKLTQALFEINRIAHLSTPDLEPCKKRAIAKEVSVLTYDFAIKVLADTAKALAPKRYDMALLKAMIEFFTEKLTKYFTHAGSLIGFATRLGMTDEDKVAAYFELLADENMQSPLVIDEDDVEELTDEIIEISRLANTSKEVLRLKNPAPYSAQEIADMIFHITLSTVTEKYNLQHPKDDEPQDEVQHDDIQNDDKMEEVTLPKPSIASLMTTLHRTGSPLHQNEVVMTETEDEENDMDVDSCVIT